MTVTKHLTIQHYFDQTTWNRKLDKKRKVKYQLLDKIRDRVSVEITNKTSFHETNSTYTLFYGVVSHQRQIMFHFQSCHNGTLCTCSDSMCNSYNVSSTLPTELPPTTNAKSMSCYFGEKHPDTGTEDWKVFFFDGFSYLGLLIFTGVNCMALNDQY